MKTFGDDTLLSWSRLRKSSLRPVSWSSSFSLLEEELLSEELLSEELSDVERVEEDEHSSRLVDSEPDDSYSVELLLVLELEYSSPEVDESSAEELEELTWVEIVGIS